MYSTSVTPQIQAQQKPINLDVSIKEHSRTSRSPRNRATTRKQSLFAQAVTEQKATGSDTRSKPFILPQYQSINASEKSVKIHYSQISPSSADKAKMNPNRIGQSDTAFHNPEKLDYNNVIFSYAGLSEVEDIPFCSTEDIGLLCRSTNQTQREYGLRILQNVFSLQRTQESDLQKSTFEALLQLPMDPNECPLSAGHILLLNLKESIENGDMCLLSTTISTLVTVLVADEGFLSEIIHINMALLDMTTSSIAFHVGPFLRQMIKFGLLDLLIQALDSISERETKQKEQIIQHVYLLSERILIGCLFTDKEWNIASDDKNKAPSIAESARQLVFRLFEQLINELEDLKETGTFLTTSSRIALRTFCYDHVLLGYSISKNEIDILITTFETVVEVFAVQNDELRPELLSAITLYYIFLSRILRGAEDLLSIHEDIRLRCAHVLQKHVPTTATELNNLLIIMSILKSKVTIPEEYLNMSTERFNEMIDWRKPGASGGFILPPRCSSSYAPFLAFSALQCQNNSNSNTTSDWISSLMAMLEDCLPHMSLTNWSKSTIEIHRQKGLLLCSINNTGVALLLVISALATTWRDSIPFLGSISAAFKQYLVRIPTEFHFIFMFPLAQFLPPRIAIEYGLYPSSTFLSMLQTVTEYPGYKHIVDTPTAQVNAYSSVIQLSVLHAACCFATPKMRQDNAWRYMIIRLALIYISEMQEMDKNLQGCVLTYSLLCILNATTGLCRIPEDLSAEMHEKILNLLAKLENISSGAGYGLLYMAPLGGLKVLGSVVTSFAKSLSEGSTMLPISPLLYTIVLHPSIVLDSSIRADMWSNLILIRLDFSKVLPNLPYNFIETDTTVILVCLSCYERGCEVVLSKYFLHKYVEFYGDKLSEKMITTAIKAALGE